jgi:GNAT superfamily N-acetyltransferase
MELHIKRLLTLEEIYSTYPLVVQLTPELSEERFRLIQQEMCKDGYCCIGAYCMEGELLGMCGYWVRHRFYCGKGFHIDNIVSATGIRGRGVGSVLMEWVEEEARTQGCDHIVLDTYLECKDAHAFYLTQGLTIRGLHFMRKL